MCPRISKTQEGSSCFTGQLQAASRCLTCGPWHWSFTFPSGSLVLPPGDGPIENFFLMCDLAWSYVCVCVHAHIAKVCLSI